MPAQATARARPQASIGAGGLNEEAREAVIGAFDALSEWRSELAESAERNSSAVFDKMAAAAKAMGWPSDFVDAARKQIEQTSKIQLQILDQVMDAWEQQIKNPGSSLSLPTAVFEKFPALPAINVGRELPGMSALAVNPLQFWMQAADMWQKSWASAMSSWMDMQESHRDSGNGGTRPRASR